MFTLKKKNTLREGLFTYPTSCIPHLSPQSFPGNWMQEDAGPGFTAKDEKEISPKAWGLFGCQAMC